ncbi:YbaB/EbfC family nucleoid-associated protein [Mycobacterium intermedium]|uniref:Nucleoid-associated protein BST27_28270 n=1 Tax=Mycobacterium intermedium TaxID=28445 RepID=A0A1E3SJS9_MYCIE|nr:YbaB/EbfC family nucleoid-associated protein [Mycobacterium intermedium]MCV6962620.1 YbaB/EbfC family nucleoid-associated protein [Mycobacterium intermedium]ODR02385.1 nucleoid-associated protein, YbaB/EbfC family [Mycobacterium intermedium]OPE48246.1 YbaB/EbfC family nucleoid-associated protein [Mycobacterium intermedium]ORA94136.1 YbaB/EbfC family nucleoid-associated protein [Mycobacterium intermedium]
MQPGGDMSQLLAQAQQMQQKLLEAQHQLANSVVHGSAGGGLVKVEVKGSGEVVGVTIDPKVVDPSDIETLQDLIVGAMRDASQQVTKMAQERLGALAGAMRPPAPPGAQPGQPGVPPGGPGAPPVPPGPRPGGPGPGLGV